MISIVAMILLYGPIPMILRIANFGLKKLIHKVA